MRKFRWMILLTVLIGFVQLRCANQGPPPVTPQCSGEEVLCNETCTSTKTDVNHCGACGTSCSANEICKDGACEPKTTCATGQAQCKSGCTDLQTDANHCGTCGTACSPGQSCVKGQCKLVCPPGQTNCSGQCIDLQTDTQHCGACGKACGAGRVCLQSKCVVVCATGQSNCSGQCVDTQTNTSHCGGCGKTCSTGQTCNQGQCSSPTHHSGNCFTIQCKGVCINQKQDTKNCGGCGLVCKSGELCCGGECVPENNDNCGRCQNRCFGHQVCQQGKCVTRTDICPTGLTLCKGSSGTQWRCVDLKTNSAHCGSCNNACPNSIGCSNGVCSGFRYPVCGNSRCDEDETCQSNSCRSCSSSSQFRNCGNNKCVDTLSDNANCGGCGLQCPNGLKCGLLGHCYDPTPSPGYGPTYCEGAYIHIGSSENCSRCRDACYFCGELTYCNNNACLPNQTYSACCGGFLTNVYSDRNNCGACNNQCASGKACVQGSCITSGATNPWTWCTKQWADVSRDVFHCGACHNRCPDGQYCVNRTCQVCPKDQYLWQGRCYPVDKNNCWGRGVVCPSNASCSNSQKGCLCSDRSLSYCRGFCIDFQNDRNHCGGCGKACPADSLCSSGSCFKVCNSGQIVCNKICVNPNTDTKNCGGCGRACGTAQLCVNGNCQ
ncbi:MAG: hypothetical protein EP343_23615 [Deltaproteobacteria bacterium]|nr:MAG: hypothetical protein EP343_23615 [Deltaproteobacteria bacterium]